MTDPAERARALTFVVVGGGFAGIECITEMEDLARAAVSNNPRVRQEEVRFVLVEAMGRIMPEVTAKQADWVVEHLRSRGIEVLLNTSAGQRRGLPEAHQPAGQDPGAGIRVRHPRLDRRCAGQPDGPLHRLPARAARPRPRPGRTCASQATKASSRTPGRAGDVAAVPDLTGSGLPDGTCVPNAQHALRQAKRLAKNLWASRWDKPLKDYKHKNLGAVAGFGEWKGVANINLLGRIGLKGSARPGWHTAATTAWPCRPFERKFRVIFGWILAFFMGRDTTQLIDLDNPRGAFVAAASPAPKPAAAPAAPAAEKPAKSGAQAHCQQKQTVSGRLQVARRKPSTAAVPPGNGRRFALTGALPGGPEDPHLDWPHDS